MYKGMDSYCGLSCEECEYREEFHCGGCMATGGNPFYGPCELAACARRKKVNFCGECKDFCCEMLHRYSYDDEEGDDPKGARIERCRQMKDFWYSVPKRERIRSRAVDSIVHIVCSVSGAEAAGVITPAVRLAHFSRTDSVRMSYVRNSAAWTAAMSALTCLPAARAITIYRPNISRRYRRYLYRDTARHALRRR